MEKKYILTDETIEHLGHTLHRIQAVKDFAGVSAGMFGGYIEREDNLDHAGNAWVSGDAIVHGNAVVAGDAIVHGNAVVADNAIVHGNAVVAGDAKVFGNAVVAGDATVHANARVSDNAIVSDVAVVAGDAWVHGNAVVAGNARVSCDVMVSGNAAVHEPSDIALVKGFGSEFRTTSFFRCADGRVRCRCGCFYGTVDDFRVIVSKTHGDSKYAKEYLMIADLMELHFKED